MTGSQRTPVVVARARAMLLVPKAAWAQIAAMHEPASLLFAGYVLPLAAIGPLAEGFGFWFAGRPAVAVVAAIAGYAANLLFVVAASLAIAAISRANGGTADRYRALQLVAYAATPGWIAAVLGFSRIIGVLAVAGSIYGLVLLAWGVRPLLGVPQYRLQRTVVLAILAEIAIGLAAGLLATLAIGPILVGSHLLHGR